MNNNLPLLSTPPNFPAANSPNQKKKMWIVQRRSASGRSFLCNPRLFAIGLLLFFVSATSKVHAGATVITWDGSTSSDWTVGSNWSGNAAPTTAQAASIPVVATNYPTITASQSIQIVDLTVASGATLNMTGGTFTLTHDWKNSGTFNATGGTYIVAGNAGGGATWIAGTNQFFNVQINSGFDPGFDNDLNGNIKVAGNWTDNNTVALGIAQPYTVTFNGTGAQTITSSRGVNNSFVNLLFNKASGGVTLASPVIVNGTCTFTSGILATDAVNILKINAGGSVSGGSVTSYVNGPLAKTGNTNFTFPVGNGSLYRPISVSTLSASATVTASYIQGDPNAAFGTTLGGGINHIGVCEYWTLDDGVATITGKVGLQFGGSCNAHPYVDDAATLLVAHFSGGVWNSLGNAASTLTSVTASTASTFSPFTIGSSSNLNPLPVKLSNIMAFEKQRGVQIEWTIYSEENLSHYEIERSANGAIFTAIGDVTARNSPVETKYRFFDPNPLPGVNFYRLKNINTDSRYGYSSVVRVTLDKMVKDITLYPNPVTTGYISFQGTDLGKGNYAVKVYNSAGVQVLDQHFYHSGGAISQTLKLPAGTRSGMYSMQLVKDGAKIMSKTFMVQ